MNFAKRFLMVAGAGALAGILAIAIAPKTAHALVAALVQVANTPSSAVPVLYAPAASNVYFAMCENFVNGFAGSCTLSPVPAGRTLVIEAASIATSTPSGSDPVNADINTVGNDIFYFIPMERQPISVGPTDNYTGQLQGRLTIPPVGSAEMTPICQVSLGGSGGSFGALMYCTMSGYTIPAN